MQNALFTYRRRVTVNGVELFNDNYINPYCVISMYWQTNEENKKVLSVFLANNYTITFTETLGKRFVNHMEDFLRLLFNTGTPVASISQQQHSTATPRVARRPTAELVDEEAQIEPEAASWVQA